MYLHQCFENNISINEYGWLWFLDDETRLIYVKESERFLTTEADKNGYMVYMVQEFS